MSLPHKYTHDLINVHFMITTFSSCCILVSHASFDNLGYVYEQTTLHLMVMHYYLEKPEQTIRILQFTLKYIF